ncbi:MAG: hypothetical protein HYT61_03230 [Candidatus Yanofskybacteria bacterium]|nr:hypothetical protein [Candidatus Yanofskybacteria bacterium]
MKKWLKFLPFLGIPIVRIIEVDMVVIPALRHYFSFWTTVALASTVATLELIYIYFIVGRFEVLAQEAAKKIARKVNKDDPEFAHQVITDSKSLLSKAKCLAEKLYDYTINKYGRLVELAKNTIFPLLKRGGYIAIFFIGIIPEPGFRVGGAIFCQIINSRKSLIALLMGNIVKTIGMVKFWELLRFMPFWLRLLIILGSLLIFALLAKFFIKKKPPE